jgi:hypothetical protein
MKRYKISCIASSKERTTFLVWGRAPRGNAANCGMLSIPTDDLLYFLQEDWKGGIDWNGLLPTEQLDDQIARKK